LKIGYFLALFPYHDSFMDSNLHHQYQVGGTEMWAYCLAHQMAKLGHEIVVFTTSIDSNNSFRDEDGIKVCRYGTNFKVEKARFSLGMFPKSLQEDVDIVHLHYSMPPADLASLIYSRTKRKPLVVTYHADSNPNYGKWIRRLGLGISEAFIVPQVLSRAKTIICNSAYYVPISRFLPKYLEKIIAIPPGIDPAEFRIALTKEECRSKLSLDASDNIILFVGHLINYKSPDLLVKAMPEILRRVQNARLVIAGSGPLFGELQRIVDKLHLEKVVRLTGSISNEEKILYYNAADIFVLPSTTSGESFGIVLLEAASAGLPLVVSSLSTFRALVIDGYNGMVAQIGDIGSLAEKIIQVLSDTHLRQEMGKNALATAAEFSWENTALKMEEVYRLVLK
jgi:glycosyltransferase involved in cell wall biosynthesis